MLSQSNKHIVMKNLIDKIQGVLDKTQLSRILDKILSEGEQEVIMKYNNYAGENNCLNLDPENSRHLEVFSKRHDENEVPGSLSSLELSKEVKNMLENDIHLYNNRITTDDTEDIIHSTQRVHGDFWTSEEKQYDVIETTRGPVILGKNSHRSFAITETNGEITDLLEEGPINKDTTEGVDPIGIYETVSHTLDKAYDIMGLDEEYETNSLAEEPVSLYEEVINKGEYESRMTDWTFDFEYNGTNSCSQFESDADKVKTLFNKLEEIAVFYRDYEADYNIDDKVDPEIPIRPMRSKKGSIYKFRLLENDVSIITKKKQDGEIGVIEHGKHGPGIDKY